MTDNNLVITDANILLDLISIDLVAEFFNLHYEISTTYDVIGELNPEDLEIVQPFLDKNNLQIVPLDSIEHEHVFSKKLSPTDRSVLIAAYDAQCIALTGDKDMGRWCKKHDIEYHGIVWIFDQLLLEEIMPHDTAINQMLTLIQINTWLPIDICKKRIALWKQEL